MAVRTEGYADLGSGRGGIRHSPMFAHAMDPAPLALGIGLEDVLAVPLMELVEVL